ncbi:J domain-containing protein [Kushneria aurantia]|uniref:DnaJ family molecular chaperone n=1 Tax=Kushneria aurantia TaxID=504092 RepID=A0ABV6G6E1_9GAMM|nr:DnaJ domain-containing protein [Kushneria aurantia]
MSARFSPFELLLLQSRRPADTASLLILAWILVNKTHILAEDQEYLRSLAHGCDHDGALDTLIDAASQQPLADIQLAAEVLIQERHDTALSNLLTRAIGLAAGGGSVSHYNRHVLGLVADLAGIQNAAFTRLFYSITGRWPQAPGDPSRHGYWPADSHAAAFNSAPRPGPNPLRAIARGFHARQLRLRARLRLRRRHARHRRWQRAHERQYRYEQAERRRREQQHQRDEQQRQQEQRQQQQHEQRAEPGNSWRRRLALQVLELEEPVSHHDIKRAYRRLAQRHHPDRFCGQGERRMALAAQRFQRIRDAYDYLIEHA